MEDDKTFDLLSKMYSEFSEFRKETNTRFDKVDARFNKVESDIQNVKNIVVGIENDHGRKLDSLMDGYKQTYEKLEVLEEKVDDLSDKVDSHAIRIQVIEGAIK